MCACVYSFTRCYSCESICACVRACVCRLPNVQIVDSTFLYAQRILFYAILFSFPRLLKIIQEEKKKTNEKKRKNEEKSILKLAK